MARHASAIVAAELRVVQSRRELREDLRLLRRRLSPPSLLATAATALIRHGVRHLIAQAAAAHGGWRPEYGGAQTIPKAGGIITAVLYTVAGVLLIAR